MIGKKLSQCCEVYDRKRTESLQLLKSGEKQKGFEEIQRFLKRFGYLPLLAPIEPGTLCSQSAAGLKAYQKFFNLHVTGVFDQQTKEHISRPRCGVPDSSSELDFRTIGAWDRRCLRIAFGAPTQQPVGMNLARQAVRNAFNTYASVDIGLEFIEVLSNEDPDILVAWRRADDPDHSMMGGTIAHADFPPGSSIITDGLPLPLHFDDEEHDWVIGAKPHGFDIETVALHEIGHNLGLLHTQVPGAVMFPSVSPDFVRRDLQPDDLAGLRSLYPLQTA